MTESAGAGSSLTEAICDLAEAVSPTTIPAPTLNRGRMSFIDTVAVMLAGSAYEPSCRLRDALGIGSVPGPATVAGTLSRGSLPEAALANGYAAHAYDYDDTLQGLTIHPSCHLVPALLGVAEAGLTSGRARDLLVALLLGIEVETLLGRVMNPLHYRRGWHATGTIGTLAAAVAVGKAMGLSQDQLRTAIAIAASSASGLRANFGTMVKPLHSGRAARNGVEAALLARQGFNGARDPLEHRFGVLAVYGSASDLRAGLPSELRPDPACSSAGRLTLKPYPCCGEATAPTQAALAVRATLGSAEGIASVQVWVTPFAREVLEFDDPTNVDEARFSGPYCVATALHQGHLGLAEFELEALENPAVRQLMGRSGLVVRDDLGEHGGGVSVTTTGGQRFEEVVRIPKGHAAIGLSDRDLAVKFSECADPILGRERTESLFGILSDLTSERTGLDWIRLLSPAE